ncbi:unnamed protein product [Fusarium venenatum]|uniref:Uncharacterized protein n=1 Tax=Fusarium venenatum TaxID=56646 RepID=A0A2L2TUF3_9HYPO|nr:uncharacterized protein FVRRES_01552 [Fusarium venenatum]CEI65040.1 unnamed protein product [Fusarium venenatum]
MISTEHVARKRQMLKLYSEAVSQDHVDSDASLDRAKSGWNRRIHGMNTEALDPSAGIVLMLASWLAGVLQP